MAITQAICNPFKKQLLEADMNFKSGDFEKTIELGEPLLEKTRKEEHSQLSKMSGESYFNLEKYKEATPHLKNDK